MTRAAEFCYIAEREDYVFLLAVGHASRAFWTEDQDLALRITEKGKAAIAQIGQINGRPLGFRKILAG